MIDTGGFRCNPVGKYWQIYVNGKTETYNHDNAVIKILGLLYKRKPKKQDLLQEEEQG